MVDMISERGWTLFCEFANDAALDVVREFYANASIARNNSTIVRGQKVDYSPRAIRTLIRLPPKPRSAPDWGQKTRDDVDLDELVHELCVPGTEWKCKLGSGIKCTFSASALSSFAKAWFLFISSNIIPSNHVSDVTVDRAILLWGILKGEYVDLGYLINQNILRFLGSNSSVSIPYASIIAYLCDASKVKWYQGEPVHKPTASITDATIDRLRLKEWPGGTPHPRGLGFVVNTSGQGAGAPPHVQRAPEVDRAGSSQSTVDMSVFDSYFRRMTRRFDAMHVSSRQYSEDMGIALEAKFQSPSTAVQWPIFGARTPYPPPDSSDEDDEGDESEDE